MRSAASPTADRPTMPEGYGLPETTEGVLPWSSVEQRLVGSKHSWLATVRPNGTPHVVPRWGVRLDGAFWYDGYAPESDAWSGDDGGGLRVVTPRRALAWFDFPTDCTRFRFRGDD